MLKIYFGDMPKAIYNTEVFFKNQYQDKWLLDPMTQDMIKSIDSSAVASGKAIDSPVLGIIPPTSLSGGVKTLILIRHQPKKVFNASTCGDNCAFWLLKLAQDIGGVVVTNDFNLNKVAKLQGVTVLNINELSSALKPVVLPGEIR